MIVTHTHTDVQTPPPFGVLGRRMQPTYPVREVWYLPDAIVEAEQVAEAWQESAYVYQANCYDGTTNWLVYNVTTATGIREMQIDPTRVVTCRWPEPVDVVVSR